MSDAVIKDETSVVEKKEEDVSDTVVKDETATVEKKEIVTEKKKVVLLLKIKTLRWIRRCKRRRRRTCLMLSLKMTRLLWWRRKRL